MLAISACGAVAYALRQPGADDPKRYVLAVVIASAIHGGLSMFSVKPESLHFLQRTIDAIVRLGMVGLMMIAMAYYTKSSEDFSRIWSLLWLVLSCGSLVLLESGVVSRDRQRRVVVVGAATATTDFIAALPLHYPGPAIVVAQLDVHQAVTWLNDPNHLQIDELIVVGTALSVEEARILMGAVHGTPVALRYFPNSDPGIPFWGNSKITEPAAARIAIKRFEDVVLGMVILVLAVPLMVLIAVAIRLTSPGPIIFRQRRLGFAGESFSIYKFRTMVPEAAHQPDAPHATPGDKRITALGGGLRRWSLDELPQLINVLKGEMSLVGPRPHSFADDLRYSAKIDDYAARLRMKPGMTGLAQVFGFRGATPNVADMERRVRLDLYYVGHWSLLLDLVILLRTPLSLMGIHDNSILVD